MSNGIVADEADESSGKSRQVRKRRLAIFRYETVNDVEEIFARRSCCTVFGDRGLPVATPKHCNRVATYERVTGESLAAFDAFEEKRARASFTESKVSGDRRERVGKKRLAYRYHVIRL